MLASTKGCTCMQQRPPPSSCPPHLPSQVFAVGNAWRFLISEVPLYGHACFWSPETHHTVPRRACLSRGGLVEQLPLGV